MASATSTPATSTSRAARSTRRSATAVGMSPSTISPTRLSRLQEKEDLRHLNDRLAAYIERVRQLEIDKTSMQRLLEEKEESTTRDMGNIRRLYESELADARSTLDATANERARLQIDFGQLADEHRKLQARNNKKESELNTAVGHWRSLEATLNSREADYANLLAESRRLENDLTDLKTQVSNLESVLQNTKTQLNSELLSRLDKENQVQTLKEQIDFQRHIGEQEVMEMRSRHESRLVEVDSGRQKEFENKMTEAMQQLRQEHEGQIQLYKEELERTFIAKREFDMAQCRCRAGIDQSSDSEQEAQVSQGEVEGMRDRKHYVQQLCYQLENAQQAAAKNSDFATSTREELAGTKLRLDSQSTQLCHLQKQNAALECRLQELERTLDHERERAQQRLSQKEQEMVDMRKVMQAQLEEYQNLLDVKLTLDMEINAYRKMLEGEEQRLHLSPSPSQHGAVSRTHTHAARRLGGRKRKHEGGPGLSPSYKVTQSSSARGTVTIEEIDLEGNYITLKNHSDTDQPLDGWVVRKSHPAIPDVSFQLPPSCVLSAGHSLTIWAAGAGIEPNPPGDLVLKSHSSWGAVDDVRVCLLNPHHEETAERRLVCVQRRAEGDSDVEFDEECVAGSEVHLRRQVGTSTGEPSCAVM